MNDTDRYGISVRRITGATGRFMPWLTAFVLGIGPSGSSAQSPNPAIPADSSVFVSWAVSCELLRGPGLITHPDSVVVSHGVPQDATGRAGDGRVVSLGDGGSAILRFEGPITDGPGVDFAVFENSFDGKFLELAFVEVSSDDEHFVRFPSASLTPVDRQVGPFGELDPDNVRNLAGRYADGWGTGFDLSELSGRENLDVNTIQAVRVVDVIGILDDSLGSRDASGRLINDPFPTPFETGGFDLDGLGVIHSLYVNHNAMESEKEFNIYPVPCTGELYLEDPRGNYRQWILLSLEGRVLRKGPLSGGLQRISLDDVPVGIYFLRVNNARQSMVRQVLIVSR